MGLILSAKRRSAEQLRLPRGLCARLPRTSLGGLNTDQYAHSPDHPDCANHAKRVCQEISGIGKASRHERLHDLVKDADRDHDTPDQHPFVKMRSKAEKSGQSTVGDEMYELVPERREKIGRTALVVRKKQAVDEQKRRRETRRAPIDGIDCPR